MRYFVVYNQNFITGVQIDDNKELEVKNVTIEEYETKEEAVDRIVQLEYTEEEKHKVIKMFNTIPTSFRVKEKKDDNLYWIVESGAFSVDEMKTLAQYANSYNNLIVDNELVFNNGKLNQIKYSIDDSKIILKHNKKSPRGNLPQEIIDILNNKSLRHQLNKEEVLEYMKQNSEQWYKDEQ